MSIQRKAILALFIVTIFLRITFPLIKISLVYISLELFVTIRLNLSCLLFLPLIFRAKFTNRLYYLLKVGAIFGSIEGLSFYFQTHGLYTVSSSQSAFLTALSVVMIPFIGSLLKVDRLGIVASCVSLVGIYELSGASFDNFTISYLCSVLAP